MWKSASWFCLNSCIEYWILLCNSTLCILAVMLYLSLWEGKFLPQGLHDVVQGGRTCPWWMSILPVSTFVPLSGRDHMTEGYKPGKIKLIKRKYSVHLSRPDFCWLFRPRRVWGLLHIMDLLYSKQVGTSTRKVLVFHHLWLHHVIFLYFMFIVSSL